MILVAVAKTGFSSSCAKFCCIFDAACTCLTLSVSIQCAATC